MLKGSFQVGERARPRLLLLAGPQNFTFRDPLRGALFVMEAAR